MSDGQEENSSPRGYFYKQSWGGLARHTLHSTLRSEVRKRSVEMKVCGQIPRRSLKQVLQLSITSQGYWHTNFHLRKISRKKGTELKLKLMCITVQQFIKGTGC